MPNLSSSTEILTAVIADLNEREKPTDAQGRRLVVPEVVAHTLGAPGQLRYTGFGREILTPGDEQFGLYARGIVREGASFSQELNFYYIGAPDAKGVRQTIGRVGLHVVRRTEDVIATADFLEALNPSAQENLIGPLGPWTVTAVTRAIQELEDRRKGMAPTSPPAEPLDMANQNLGAVAAFVADPFNREAYHKFNYGPDRYANGIVVAQA